MSHNFGEKRTELVNGKEIPVWMSPKYEASKKKAIEVIESGKYGLEDGDFWILMNATKNGKMAYTGLITSHNACLKINASLENKFVPSSVSVDKAGFGGSLVYTYCNDEQGIYEVGEASPANCKNAYPYAMALKRLFDRVVLKLSRLAYSGVYSETEADEFREPVTAPEKNAPILPLVEDANTQPATEEMKKALIRKMQGIGKTFKPGYNINSLTKGEYSRWMKVLEKVERVSPDREDYEAIELECLLHGQPT